MKLRLAQKLSEYNDDKNHAKRVRLIKEGSFSRRIAFPSGRSTNDETERYEEMTPAGKLANDLIYDSKEEMKKLELQFDNHANETFKCDCALCIKELRKRKSLIQRGVSKDFFENFDFNLVNSELEKDFVFIIKRLIPSKNVPRSLRLFIPDTVAFINGEVKFIIMTGKV